VHPPSLSPNPRALIVAVAILITTVVAWPHDVAAASGPLTKSAIGSAPAGPLTMPAIAVAGSAPTGPLTMPAITVGSR
jgi:hypothetical protein